MCRGMLYSARTGDATPGEIERILEGTGEETLVKLLGKESVTNVAALGEALPKADADALLAIRGTPY